jgi:signal transduction histidine kinase
LVAMRMRTKLLLCLLTVSFGLTALSLVVIRTSLQRHTRERLNSDLSNSLNTFQNLQAQRREMLRREAALLADLPSLKALMTSGDTRTIQDGGAEFWKVSGSDFFALVRPDGNVQALYDDAPAGDRTAVENQLRNALSSSVQHTYLLDHGRLYESFFEPLYFGRRTNGTLLGYVAMGYEINDSVAREVGQVAAADVVFYANGAVASSTLRGRREANVSGLAETFSKSGTQAEDTYPGGEHYLAASVPLSENRSPSVRLLVLKSYDDASRYLSRLNGLIASLGVLVLILGGGLALYLSGTITRPLETLVSGAHALGSGDFDSQLPSGGAKEIRELSDAFDMMRRRLKETQQELLDAERLATIGEMASSISHDLRHHLSAVYANAEFLGYSTTNQTERVELLSEIRFAVQDMTELIESLLLFSRTGRTLQPSWESIPLLMERAVALVKTHPDARGIHMTVDASQQIETWVDAKKIERAIYNLLLNACQAAKQGGEVPAVSLSLRETNDRVCICITDNGPGIAESIRRTLFEPFVSQGKQSGIGLGLTLAQRIAQEHGGDVTLEQNESRKTTFTLSFARNVSGASSQQTEAKQVLPAP